MAAIGMGWMKRQAMKVHQDRYSNLPDCPPRRKVEAIEAYFRRVVFIRFTDAICGRQVVLMTGMAGNRNYTIEVTKTGDDYTIRCVAGGHN